MNLERGVFLAVSLAGAALTAGAFLLGSSAAPSVAIGAATAIVNLWALRGVVRVLTSVAAGGQAPRGFTVFLSLKMLALFGFVWLLLTAGVATAGGLAVGYTSLPIGVAIGALLCEKPAA